MARGEQPQLAHGSGLHVRDPERGRRPGRRPPRGLYPHGLRLGPGDRTLLVADARAPLVQVFDARASGWNGIGYPATMISNPREGGPKGIDVDLRTNVLVVTSECQLLAFFDTCATLAGAQLDGAADARVRYELDALADIEQIKADAAEARSALAELHQTKAWRLMEPVRRADGAALRLRARR